MKKLLATLLTLTLFCTMSSLAFAAEVKGDVVLYSSMTDNDINNLIECLQEEFPDLSVEVINGSAGELVARIRAEAANPQGDIMWGGLNNGDGMTHADLFETWLSDYESEIYEDYRSNNGFYNFDHLSTVVFCINKELEKELGMEIKGYKDLLDPRLKGKIVFSDPNSSSAAWNNVCNIMAVYGNDSPEAWTFIEGLMKNQFVLTTSSSVCFKGVDAGEYVVGLTYEDGASTLQKSGSDKTRMVYPEEGSSAFAFGCAVIKGAKNIDNAKAVANFLMSPEGQSKLGNKLGTLRFTNSKASYESPYLPKTEDIKWVKRDMSWLVENKAAVLEKWNSMYNEFVGK